jgi:hypothetical protein
LQPDFEKLFVPSQGRTLIVGSRIYGNKEDRRKRYADAVGVDMQPGDGVDIVHDLEDVTSRLGHFAHVECMSMLEHCRRPWIVCENLELMMEPGGTIFITAPFVWRVHGYPDDYWRFTTSGIKSLFNTIEWKHEAYVHRDLCAGQDVPCVKAGNDWPFFARTEVMLFGRKP